MARNHFSYSGTNTEYQLISLTIQYIFFKLLSFKMIFN